MKKVVKKKAARKKAEKKKATSRKLKKKKTVRRKPKKRRKIPRMETPPRSPRKPPPPAGTKLTPRKFRHHRNRALGYIDDDLASEIRRFNDAREEAHAMPEGWEKDLAMSFAMKHLDEVHELIRSKERLERVFDSMEKGFK